MALQPIGALDLALRPCRISELTPVELRAMVGGAKNKAMSADGAIAGRCLVTSENIKRVIKWPCPLLRKQTAANKTEE